MAQWITEESFYNVRYTEMQDEKHLFAWLSIEEVVRWFPVATIEESALFAKNWIGFSRYCCSLTGTVHGVPRGIATLFLMPYRKIAHLCMGYLVIDPMFQNRGIGTSLLRNLMHLGKTYFHLESVHFEVYEGSAFISILKKNRCQEIFRQEKYVKTKQGYMSRMVFEINFLNG